MLRVRGPTSRLLTSGASHAGGVKLAPDGAPHGAAALLADLHGKATSLRVLDPVPDPRAVARAFTSAVKRAGITPPITFHGLRKVAATRMLQGGADLKVVMSVGGWADPGTLLRVHAAVTEEAKRKAVAAL